MRVSARSVLPSVLVLIGLDAGIYACGREVGLTESGRNAIQVLLKNRRHCKKPRTSLSLAQEEPKELERVQMAAATTSATCERLVRVASVLNISETSFAAWHPRQTATGSTWKAPEHWQVCEVRWAHFARDRRWTTWRASAFYNKKERRLQGWLAYRPRSTRCELNI